MKKFLFWAVAVVLLGAVAAGAAIYRGLAGPAPLAASPRDGAIFDDVVLVEPGVGRVAHQRLAIEGNRIASLGASDGDAGPWSGAFVLPGLVDAHGHFPPTYLPGQIELFSFLFLRHGVTGVRSLGDVGEGASVRAKSAVREGSFAAPRVATCGRFVDGEPRLWENSEIVRRPEEAEAAVAAIAADGFDCVKVYNQLDAESLAAIRDAAHARNLPVVGHVPFRVRHEDAHLDDAQHLLGFHPADGPPKVPGNAVGWLSVEDSRVDSIAAAVLADGAAMTPTLVAIDRIRRPRELLADADDPVWTQLPPWYGNGLWNLETGMNPGSHLTPDERAILHKALEAQRHVLRRLHEAGVPLRTGTDTLAPMLVPGASLHHELSLFVLSGLTPEEAITASTRDAAAILGVPGLGTLRAGAPADLAIFREDPTRDLAALETLMAVVVDGRVYTRLMLDAQMARYRSDFDGFLSRRVATPAFRAGLDLVLSRVVRRPAGDE